MLLVVFATSSLLTGSETRTLSARSTTSVVSSRARRPTCAATMPNLYDPVVREKDYSGNIAKYLVDLHDSRATFDFCGGMMFQLVLSEKLRTHLEAVAAGDGKQPVLFDASKPRMANIPEYSKDASADNSIVFHGREVRNVANAAGGMGFALQLSHTEDDPEGWTAKERAVYDGWGHDAGRVWNLARESDAFTQRFGAGAVTLQHRFYLHLDRANRMWLSAEDGCEGVVAPARAKVFGLF